MIVAVIGYGSIGKRHADNLVALGHAVAIYDPAFPNGYNLEEIIANSDAVVIASPTSEHNNHTILARMHGKKTFLEKPVGHSELLPIQYDYVAMVGYNLRFHSCVKKAKEWLDAGLIGNPIWANFTLGQFNERPDYLRDGVLLNWSHELDLALYLCGPAHLAASSTHITDSGQDDLTDILLTHENGCRSTVHLDYIARPEIRSFHIVGDKGSIGSDLVNRRASRWGIDSDGSKESFIGEDTWNDNYIEEMQAFIDRIDGKKTIGCTGAEGLEVLKICLEVRKQAGLA